MNLNPLTLKKIKNFKESKRGYYSFILILSLIIFALLADFFINNKALVVKYEGQYYFPVVSDVRLGTEFGLDYQSEANYRELQRFFEEGKSDNFVVMPFIPYGPNEQHFIDGEYPPYAPSIETQHYLGTDVIGRDMIARLVYGFRIAILFALSVTTLSYLIGVSVGCLQGYLGGKFDLISQRVIEIWSMIPYLYAIMIIASVASTTFALFVAINVLFGWTGATFVMRTMTYKESAREYVLAAKALGASTPRVLFNHILPNTLVYLVTMLPFAITGAITALTALDYLGLGLSPPTPSWGELLSQGQSNLDKPWIVMSTVFASVLVLTLITFVGEAVRAAFDPKKFTRYE